MTNDQKNALTGYGKNDINSIGRRVRAARKVIGYSQDKLGSICGVTKSTISGIERGVSYPNNDLMGHLYFEHKIDFNFIMVGDLSEVPSKTADKILEKLAISRTD